MFSMPGESDLVESFVFGQERIHRGVILLDRVFRC